MNITKSREALPIVVPAATGVVTPVGGASCGSPTSFPQWSYIPHSEEISYQKGGKTGAFKNCNHIRSVEYFDTHPLREHSEDLTPVTSPGQYCLVGLPAFPRDTTLAQYAAVGVIRDDILTDNIFNLFDAEDYSIRAIQGMWPGIENRVGESLANFAIEFKEIRNLPRSIKSAWEIWNDPLALNYYRRASAGMTGRIKHIIQRLANANLAYEYGIKTLMSDLLGIAMGVANAVKDYNRLKANANKKLRSHYRLRISELVDQTGSQSYPSTQEGITATEHFKDSKSEYGDAWFTATMSYTYTVPDMPPSLAKAMALLDSLGLNFNPNIIWNAIKWSFVLDWFLEVSNYLNQFKVPLIDPTVVIHDYCCSIKVTRKDVCTRRIYGTQRDTGYYDIHRGSYLRYKRWNEIPNLYSALKQGEFSLYKARMGASLLLGGR